MKKILILIGGYLPGYKVGGPVQSIKNLTDCLHKEYEFYILTADRDLGDKEAYENIRYDDWNQVGNAKVWYVKPGGFRDKIVVQLAEQVEMVYVCGCLSDYSRTVMRLKKQGKIAVPVVIAPMGSFSPGAFRIKYPKKKAYIIACKMLGWFRNIIWCVTGEQDREDVYRIIGKNAVCYLAQNVPRMMEHKPAPLQKEKGALRIVFLSRISPKKNLDFALDILCEIQGNIIFDIYGVMEDQDYFARCKEKMEQMPDNIACEYKGAVESRYVLEIFEQYHVFLFPTKGENFGHVIYEAMAGGCIPIISDQCPWGILEEQQIGRVFSLEDKAGFVKAVRQMADMEQAEYEQWQKRAVNYAWEFGQHADAKGYRDIFELANEGAGERK